MKNTLLFMLTVSLITTAFATGRSEAPVAPARDCVQCKLQAELKWARSVDQLTTANGSYRFAVRDEYLMLRSPR
jgi:hypothetical protein